MSPEPSFLIVRLSALGDIIHALPVAVSLREAFPAARIDWLVSSRHRAILEQVGQIEITPGVISAGQIEITPGVVFAPVIDRMIVVERTSKTSLAEAIGQMRKGDYEVAFDLQGLMKSAVLARSSGARRVVGFAPPHLRERWAHLFYTETVAPPAGVHVIDKNLALLQAVGLRDFERRFPPLGPAAATTVSDPFVIINPGAGWPNKRWPPEWFGEIARRVRDRFGMRAVVLWGPNEESLARMVVASSHGAATLAPATGIGEMIALVRSASLFVAGDTGPLHIAAAVGTPIVGLYGPTSPARNGPWDPADQCVSRFEVCQCHHRRRCRLEVCCLLDISVDAVMAAVERRLGVAFPNA